MTLEGADVEVGDRVRVVNPGSFTRVNTSQRYNLNPEQGLMVTRVFRESLIVRTTETIPLSTDWGGTEYREASFQISRSYLEMDGEGDPRPRKLGKKPEGEEFIGIDDPGIQWLFEDMGRYAEQQGYCNQYDALCAKLGIPGRPRPFSVHQNIGGIEVSATIAARSQREANERFQAAINERKIEVPPEEQTPEYTNPPADYAIAG
jgi:hypothetical protein